MEGSIRAAPPGILQYVGADADPIYVVGVLRNSALELRKAKAGCRSQSGWLRDRLQQTLIFLLSCDWSGPDHDETEG